MPTYDYFCSHCGNKQEVFQKITDSKLNNCPNCNQKKFVRRPSGGIAVSFRSESTSQPSKGECCPCGKSKNSCGST